MRKSTDTQADELSVVARLQSENPDIDSGLLEDLVDSILDENPDLAF